MYGVSDVFILVINNLMTTKMRSSIGTTISQIRLYGSAPIRHRPDFHSTTVLNVRKGNKVVMIADG